MTSELLNMEKYMNFIDIAESRQSCRSYDSERNVEEDKLARILETARLAPSACNGQPYFITVCKGTAAQKVAMATRGMGLNKFLSILFRVSNPVITEISRSGDFPPKNTNKFLIKNTSAFLALV